MCLKYAVHPFLCISICCSSRDLMNIRWAHTHKYTHILDKMYAVCVCVQFGRNWTKIQFHARICVCSANAFHMQLLLLVGIVYEMFVCVCVCKFLLYALCTMHISFECILSTDYEDLLKLVAKFTTNKMPEKQKWCIEQH